LVAIVGQGELALINTNPYYGTELRYGAGETAALLTHTLYQNPHCKSVCFTDTNWPLLSNGVHSHIHKPATRVFIRVGLWCRGSKQL
jgi:hypothetical protein